MHEVKHVRGAHASRDKAPLLRALLRLGAQIGFQLSLVRSCQRITKLHAAPICGASTTIRISKAKPLTSSPCTCVLPSMPPCSVSMRRPRFRRWIGSIRCYRFPLAARSATDSNTTGTERSLCSGAGHRHGPGSRQDRRTPHQSGFRRLPEGDCCSVSA